MVNGARGRTGADVTSPAPMEHVCAHVRVQIPPQPMVASIVQDPTPEALDVRLNLVRVSHVTLIQVEGMFKEIPLHTT